MTRLLASTLFFLHSCFCISSIYDTLSSNSNLTIFKAAIDANSTIQSLYVSGSYAYSIFAPLNSGINNSTFNTTTASIQLQYYMSTENVNLDKDAIISTILDDTADPSGKYHPLGMSQFLNPIIISSNTVIISSGVSNATVVEKITCTDGFIYLLSTGLNLPTNLTNIALTYKYLVFSQYLSSKALLPGLEASQGITVFMPTDAGLTGYNIGEMSSAQQMFLLQSHIINSVITLDGSFANGTQLLATSGKALTITVNNGVYFVDDVPIILRNIPLVNGVVHLLDTVIYCNEIQVDVVDDPGVTAATNDANDLIAGFKSSLMLFLTLVVIIVTIF